MKTKADPKKKTVDEAFRKAFFERLKSFGIRETAKHIGRNEGSLSRYGQAGNSLPRIHEIKTIAESLGVSAGWLAFGEGSSKKPPDDDQEVLEWLHTISPSQRKALMQLAGGLTPGDVSEPPSPPGKFGPLRLPPDQLEAFLDWLLGQIETMKSELPLTKACRAVATRLADDNAPEASQGTSAESDATKGASGKDVPTAKAPVEPRVRRHQDPKKP